VKPKHPLGPVSSLVDQPHRVNSKTVNNAIKTATRCAYRRGDAFDALVSFYRATLSGPALFHLRGILARGERDVPSCERSVTQTLRGRAIRALQREHFKPPVIERHEPRQFARKLR
jgi:hypothetical protein